MTKSTKSITIDELLETSKAGGKDMAIQDGVYSGVVVAVVTTLNEFNDPKNGVTQSEGTKFVIQITDDEGKVAYLTSKSFKASLHEKSGFRSEMSSWMKKTDPKEIIDTLIKANIIKDNKFSFSGFLGKAPSCMVTMTPSKKDTTKSYPTVKSLIPTKKGSEHKVVVGEIPNWLFRDNIGFDVLEGFTIAPEKKEIVGRERPASANAPNLMGSVSPADAEDSPF